MKLVIFDVDGTLVDSQAHIVASMVAAFDEVKQPVPSRDTLLSIVGLSLPIAMRELAPDVSDQQLSLMVDAYKEAFQEHRLKQGAAASPLYPGARDAIAALAARDDVLMSIATGKSRRGLDALMEAWEFSGVFVSAECADDHPSKPHPSMVFQCLVDADVAAQDAVVIGDTSYDMEMARAARAKSIGVNWGYHSPDVLFASGATVVLEKFAELEPALDDMWKGA